MTTRRSINERALAMVRKIRRDTEAVSATWCPVGIIVQRPSDADVLAFAVARGWLELSPNDQRVRVTDEGSRWRVRGDSDL